MRFQLRRDAEDRFSLNIEGEDRVHEFRTLLSALAFAHEIVGEKEIPITVLDSKGQVVDESVIGPAW